MPFSYWTLTSLRIQTRLDLFTCVYQQPLSENLERSSALWVFIARHSPILFFRLILCFMISSAYKAHFIDLSCHLMRPFLRLEKAMAPHSSTLAWKIPWTEEPGRLQSMGSLRVGHDWATSLSLFTFIHWRRKWQPTPVFCLENPRDGKAWWAAVYGVAQSRTWLKWLSLASLDILQLQQYLLKVSSLTTTFVSTYFN